MAPEINKKIWFMWYQGMEMMPELVQTCYHSWETKNKDWELILLHEGNLNLYLKGEALTLAKSNTMPIQAKSDIIRINLLKDHGGVWVDASCFCVSPLDTWLPQHLSTGFFAFSRPAKDRMISSWFLASNRNNKLVETYCSEVNKFWILNKGIKHYNWKEILMLKIIGVYWILSKRPHLWLSQIMVKLLKRFPYLWFHYTFEKLYHSNKSFKKIWDRTNKISADDPHALQNMQLDSSSLNDISHHLDITKIHVFKLSLKRKYNNSATKNINRYLNNLNSEYD